MGDATSPLLTTEHFDQSLKGMDECFDRHFAEFRAELYRALWIQGGVIIGAVVAAAFTLAQTLD
ncbi:MAG: hypothetical protein OXG61_08130 [Chloroflexi bacterium]|nr:hypothetical protein [Chloroflexota bacterium]